MSTKLNESSKTIKNNLEQRYDWINSFHVDVITRVERRVVRQLIQTLLYEGMIPYSQEVYKDGSMVFTIIGQTTCYKDVKFKCRGRVYQSFSIIRLNKNLPIQRIQKGVVTEATLDQVIDEILWCIPNAVCLDSFINELKETLIKDIQARSLCQKDLLSDKERSFDELESNLLDAHTYHPCYKSRIGFTISDNYAYAPEFKTPIYLVWLAIKKDYVSINSASHIEPDAYIKEQIGDDSYNSFISVLSNKNLESNDYQLIPVHPWQWENKLVSLFFDELKDNVIVLLGKTNHCYRAQQSLRSLTNFSDFMQPYIKLSLSITNTSSTRILARHTVMNAAYITEWLQKLVEESPIAKILDFVILGEVMGVSFNNERFTTRRMKETHGVMGSIWRESIHTYLRAGETAFPFNGLSYIQDNGEPLIDVWIKSYGLEVWLKQLLTVSVLPIIHMLFAEGIGMESHGQNIILIHQDGWPTRIALKDFHDGVRYVPAYLSKPEAAPILVPVPASHSKINRNSFILTDNVDEVRDFSCDCFFFICLTDVAVFLFDKYKLDESMFWKNVADIIKKYQFEHPEYQKSFECFDVFSPSFQVEELTKRRLLGDADARFKAVPNPLAEFK